jgi:hypothetical protein
MSVPDTPDILFTFTDFETRLLARIYPFMNIVLLPKDKQRRINNWQGCSCTFKCRLCLQVFFERRPNQAFASQVKN